MIIDNLSTQDPKRPTQYDGRSSCRDYLVQFDMISKLNRWDNITYTIELATNLSGQALAILTDIEPQQRQDYAALISALIKALLTRFEPDNQSEVFRAQLKCRTRKHGEGLAETNPTLSEKLSLRRHLQMHLMITTWNGRFVNARGQPLMMH